MKDLPTYQGLEYHAKLLTDQEDPVISQEAEAILSQIHEDMTDETRAMIYAQLEELESRI